MCTARFGNDSGLVQIEIAEDQSPGSKTHQENASLIANIEIRVPGFLGRISEFLDLYILKNFVWELRRLYDTLQGQAELHPLDDDFVVKLKAGRAGLIEVSGHAYSFSTGVNKLSFEFDIDQTFLSEPLAELERFLA
jgi:hypothetical protein